MPPQLKLPLLAGWVVVGGCWTILHQHGVFDDEFSRSVNEERWLLLAERAEVPIASVLESFCRIYGQYVRIAS